jgi:hypothetical protein
MNNCALGCAVQVNSTLPKSGEIEFMGAPERSDEADVEMECEEDGIEVV